MGRAGIVSVKVALNDAELQSFSRRVDQFFERLQEKTRRIDQGDYVGITEKSLVSFGREIDKILISLDKRILKVTESFKKLKEQGTEIPPELEGMYDNWVNQRARAASAYKKTAGLIGGLPPGDGEDGDEEDGGGRRRRGYFGRMGMGALGLIGAGGVIAYVASANQQFSELVENMQRLATRSGTAGQGLRGLRDNLERLGETFKYTQGQQLEMESILQQYGVPGATTLRRAYGREIGPGVYQDISTATGALGRILGDPGMAAHLLGAAYPAIGTPRGLGREAFTSIEAIEFANRWLGMARQISQRQGAGPGEIMRSEEQAAATTQFMQAVQRGIGIPLGMERGAALMQAQDWISQLGPHMIGMGGAQTLMQMQTAITSPEPRRRALQIAALRQKYPNASYLEMMMMIEQGLSNAGAREAYISYINRMYQDPEAKTLAYAEFFNVPLMAADRLRKIGFADIPTTDVFGEAAKTMPGGEWYNILKIQELARTRAMQGVVGPLVFPQIAGAETAFQKIIGGILSGQGEEVLEGVKIGATNPLMLLGGMTLLGHGLGGRKGIRSLMKKKGLTLGGLALGGAALSPLFGSMVPADLLQRAMSRMPSFATSAGAASPSEMGLSPDFGLNIVPQGTISSYDGAALSEKYNINVHVTVTPAIEDTSIIDAQNLAAEAQAHPSYTGRGM